MPAHSESSHSADWRLSPFSGWTRANWEATADRMLLAVRPYASPGNALIGLPGPGQPLRHVERRP